MRYLLTALLFSSSAALADEPGPDDPPVLVDGKYVFADIIVIVKVPLPNVAVHISRQSLDLQSATTPSHRFLPSIIRALDTGPF